MSHELGVQFQIITPQRNAYIWQLSRSQGWEKIFVSPDFVSASKASYGYRYFKHHPYQFKDINIKPGESFLYLSFLPKNNTKPARVQKDKISFTRTLIEDAADLVEDLIANPKLKRVETVLGLTNPTMSQILTRKFGFQSDPDWYDDEDFKEFGTGHKKFKKEAGKFLIATKEEIIKAFQIYQGRIPRSDSLPETGFMCNLFFEARGRRFPLRLWK